MTGITKNEEIDDDSARFSISNIIKERLNTYFEESEIFYAKKKTLDTAKMAKYTSTPSVVGMIDPKDFVPVKGMAIVRTLSGDKNVEIRKNTLFIIDSDGNISVITEDNFNNNYKMTRRKFKHTAEYSPTIKNADTGRSYALMDFIKPCIYVGSTNIYAKKLSNMTKLFPYCDNDNYMLGLKGDYIAVSEDDPRNIFIIKKDMFKKTYKAFK